MDSPAMKATTERHSPERIRSPEQQVIDAMHRYAYGLVEEFARPGDRLLDIGFGEGYGSELVRPWVSEYHGVEVSRDVVDHARAKYAHPAASFRHYDGEILPFGDDDFDLAISFQVIEHVVDVSRYLREIRRVCRPDATVLIVTPNRNHRVGDGERPWNRYHVREYSPEELAETLATVFPQAEIQGIHGSEPMERIERARVAQARRLARLDPLGLRYVLPESIDTRLRMLLGRVRSCPESTEARPDLRLDEMHHSGSNVETSLDLLGIARK